MTDREVLIWIHQRLVLGHGESDIVDYMHKLRAVIAGLPADQRSPQTCTNSMAQLLRELPEMDKRRAEGWLKRLARRWVDS